MHFYVSFSANALLEHFPLQDNTPILNHGQFHLQNKVFPSVFAFEDGQFYLKVQLDGYKITDCSGDIFVNTPLYDGMMIEAIHQDPNLSYSLFVQKLDLLSVSHKYFYCDADMFIGSGKNCHIQSKLENTLAKNHAKIKKQGNRFVVTAQQNSLVYVNGKLCDNKRLETGDVIWCQGLSIVFMGEFLAISCQGFSNVLDEYFPKMAEFPPLEDLPAQLERPPRISVPLETGVVEISAPTPKPSGILSVAVTSLPSYLLTLLSLLFFGLMGLNLMTMGSMETLMVYGVLGGGFLLGAIALPSFLKSQHKKSLHLQDDHRMEKYLHYTNDKTRELEEKYNRNRKVWNDVLSPAPERLVKMVEKFQAENCLWERCPQDHDFLALRLGLGSHDFEVTVKVPEDFFDLEEDPLLRQPQSIANRYKVLKDVPEVISLVQEKQVGVFGQREKIYELLQALMMEVMSLHSPDFVKIACFFSEEEKEHFLWAKDLPALWSNDQSIRFMATMPDEAHAVLRHIEHRCQHHPNRETYVFFVTNQALLQEKFLTKHFTQSQNPQDPQALYSIYFAENFSSLPSDCRAVVRCQLNYSGIYCKREQQNWFIKFNQDDAGEYIREDFQRAMLAVPFKLHIDQEELVDKVGFLDMFHCACVEDLQIAKRWLNHRSYKTLSAPLGLTAGEALFSLDIHEEYHGCHGLVVGEVELDKTTLLQSLVLSMMVCHSPLDFSVLLMEFTGTQFVHPFQQAPHVLGTVTSIPQCRGIMIPLRMEIQRRKRLFRNIAKEYQLDTLDINGYQKYFLEGKVTEVMTRIAVVVDEFMPLLKEAPKLLEELLHLVKVGQRLGIHLILATASPSVAKDANFASQFRVCLNLSHTKEFQELMGVAPTTSLRHAGRCIVQVGQNEVFAEVQTGNCLQTYVKQEHFLPPHAQTVDIINYAGERIRRYPIKNRQEITDKTQLEAVLEQLTEVSERNNCRVDPFLFHAIEYAREEGELHPDYVPVDEHGNPLPKAPLKADENTSNFAYLTQLKPSVVEEEVEAEVEEEVIVPEPEPEPEESFSYEEPVAPEPEPEPEESFSYEEPIAPESEESFSYEEPVAPEPESESEESFSYEEPVAPEPEPEPEESYSYEEPVAPEPEPEPEPEESYSYEEPVAPEPEESYSYEEPVAPVSELEESYSYEEPIAPESEESYSYEEPVAPEPEPEESYSYEDPVAPEPEPEPEESFSYEEPVAPEPEESYSYEEPVAPESEPEDSFSYEEPVAPEPEESYSYEEPVAPVSEQSYDEDYDQQDAHSRNQFYVGEEDCDLPQPPPKAVPDSSALEQDYSKHFQTTQDYQEYEDHGYPAQVSEPPVVEIPEVEPPVVEIPEVEPPVVDIPEVEAPVVDIPEVEAPVVDIPEVEAPVVEIPEVEAPEVEAKQISPFTPPPNFVKSNNPSLDAARAAFLSRTGKKSTLEQADFSTIRFQEGLFIGGSQHEVVENLLLTFAKFTKIDYVFSSNSHGKCSKLCDRLVWGESEIDRAVEEIRLHLWSNPEDSCVLLIPSYHQFCQVVSQRSLDRLQRILKKQDNKLVVMTGDTPENLAQYGKTDFARYTLKQNQGIVTNPEVLSELLPYMAEGLTAPTTEVNNSDFLYYYENTWKILYL